MKKYFIIQMMILSSLAGIAQGISISQSGTPADESAMLDITSTTKGMLIPRMNTAHRIGIVAPAQGLIVYDTDSRNFWFYDGGWNQINSGGGGSSGPASGDLSGNYPSPNVIKIQNLDVAFGVPNDHQVLKWDALSNNWKGRNDSLFLPYNVAFGNATKLFGIQNNNTSNGASAVCGKSGSAGSGITPGSSMGVWGDNSNGLGVVGTSNTGIGTYGFSFGNHGVYGYSTLANFAGVCGSHANANGIGVLGEVQTTGKAVYGRSTGVNGTAGFFENTNSASADTTLIVKNAGFGAAGYFTTSNQTNGNAVVEVSSNAAGDGIYSELTNTGNHPHANFRAYNQSLGGYAFYGQTDLGTSAYFYNTGATNNSYVVDAKTVGLASVGNFTIANNSNNNYIIQGTSNGSGGGGINLSLTNSSCTGIGFNFVHSGTGDGMSVAVKNGKAAIFSNTDANSNNSVETVTNIGNNKGLVVTNSKATNISPAISVIHNGTGPSILADQTNAANTEACVKVSSSGKAGISVSVTGTDALISSSFANNGIGVYGKTSNTATNTIGVKGETGDNGTGGIGVLGIGGASDATAIGVKGISTSSSTDRGAVTGINNSTGIGVYGEATGTDGIGIYGIAGNNSANNKAAVFKNNNTANTRSIVEISGSSSGNNLFLNNTNGANTSALIKIRNYGTGNFLTMEDGASSSVTTIAKNGNITTDGTLVVKSNKGIVRNSSATQLRTELLTANLTLPGGGVTLSPMESYTTTITFGTAFSSSPSVYIANISSDGDNASFMLTSIKNVTTTGCTLYVRNIANQDIFLSNSSWKVVAIGAE